MEGVVISLSIEKDIQVFKSQVLVGKHKLDGYMEDKIEKDIIIEFLKDIPLEELKKLVSFTETEIKLGEESSKRNDYYKNTFRKYDLKLCI